MLTVGAAVRVRWGDGLGFRAEGEGVVTRVFEKSVRVRLTADVSSPHEAGRIDWPAGFELKRIPKEPLTWDGVFER